MPQPPGLHMRTKKKTFFMNPEGEHHFKVNEGIGQYKVWCANEDLLQVLASLKRNSTEFDNDLKKSLDSPKIGINRKRKLKML
ncbi:hypothetical protein TSAR_010389 [Trichomalopsis sarcophagae]|uniref:Uncharacterized protein n=1 Tax=Trichomalopsis sarcophagae TaxID=543379 RepID=A0A232EK04_9HYME|nr:hypothetical protein TSAR_010389 [Trichomalopsis sarcophagae]